MRLGDAFIFGTAGFQLMGQMIPSIREAARAAGKGAFPIAGLAYVAVGDDPKKALDEAAHHLLPYYGSLTWRPVEELIHHGPPQTIAEAARAYEAAGVDVLILVPQIPDLSQVERLAQEVLPGYR